MHRQRKQPQSGYAVATQRSAASRIGLVAGGRSLLQASLSLQIVRIFPENCVLSLQELCVAWMHAYVLHVWKGETGAIVAFASDDVCCFCECLCAKKDVSFNGSVCFENYASYGCMPHYCVRGEKNQVQSKLLFHTMCVCWTWRCGDQDVPFQRFV